MCRAVFRDSLKACAVACSPVKAERISEIVYHLKNDRGRNRNHAGELLPLNAEGEDNVVWRVYVPVVLSPSIVLQRSRIQVWLYEQVNMRLEGCIIVSIGMSLDWVFCWLFFKVIKLFLPARKS